MEEDDIPEEPIGFKGLLDAIQQLEPETRMELKNALVAFIDKLYRSTCIVFDQGAEPRGFASPAEERAAAISLSIFTSITKGLSNGMESAAQMYLDILDEVQKEPVYAYDILVKKSTNPATLDEPLYPCETDPDPEVDTTRDPDREPGIRRRPTPGE